MRVTILAIGSRGDVQPYVALGCGLKKRGHLVRIAAFSDFSTFIASYGLEAFSLPGNPREALAGDLVKTGRSAASFWRETFLEMGLGNLDFLNECVKSCAGAEAILFSPIGYAAREIGKALGIPAFAAFYVPATRTGAFPNLLFPPLAEFLPFHKAYNRFTYLLEILAFWRAARKAVSRAKLPFFPPFKEIFSDRNPVLYGFSPSFIPKPGDWGDWVHVTGYWFLDTPLEWKPPADLQDFLAAGPPPVFFGFGSVARGEPEETTGLILKALSMTGQRGILGTGWGGITGKGKISDGVFAVDEVPHSWLFPRMSLLVHHGGAGTLAAGLRSGIPSLLIPFFADQFFWGERVSRQGVGPRPIPRRILSVKLLAEGIHNGLSSKGMRERAAALGEKIRSERGVEMAADIVEREVARVKGIRLLKGSGAHD